MTDSTREIRAMILGSLPFPPIPVEVGEVEPDALVLTGEPKVTTTHTLISQLLVAAAHRGDQEANMKRQAVQREVFQRLLFDLASGGFDLDSDGLYRLYCDASRAHISSYFDSPPEIKFVPMRSVARGDPVHAKMCEYMAAQSILFKDEPPITREAYAKRMYPSLLVMCRDRLGHTMTDEEKRLADLVEGDRIEEIPAA